MKNENEGYIYVYKCMVGSGSDVCKIGKSKDYLERLRDHVRRPYHGFVPYAEFTTGKAIATVYKINNIKMADQYIKEMFGDKQFGNYEIYNLDYDETIKTLYIGLKERNALLELIKDGYSIYDFANNEHKQENVDLTTKKNYETIINMIIDKNNGNIPNELLIMLRDKNDFVENCKSHYNTRNYIDFKNGMILDLNYNKEKRTEILNKLKEMI